MPLRYLRPAVILLTSCVCLSSLAFILTVKRPVFDDANNLPDVHRYATQGVSFQTIARQINPSGPTGFIWMAEVARVFDSDELELARLTALASWVLLAIGILSCAGPAGSNRDLWYAGLLVTLVFPHTATSSATVLTEGPALLFATMGVLLWVTPFSTDLMSAESLARCALGGLLMGLSVTCRQYYLALLPSMLLVALLEFRRRRIGWRPGWLIAVSASLILAAVPVGVLVYIWKGLSSPAMAAGTSYHAWRSSVALNFTRPLVALFYALLYLFPLTVPAIRTLTGNRRVFALILALLSAALLQPLRDTILQPGPLRSALLGMCRTPPAESVVFAALTALIGLGAAAFAWLVWTHRSIIWSERPVLFSVSLIVFFVLEQGGVGGNIPFYDRYILQLAPFLGIISFAFLPSTRAGRVGALAGLFLLSEAMLWRYAF